MIHPNAKSDNHQGKTLITLNPGQQYHIQRGISKETADLLGWKPDASGIDMLITDAGGSRTRRRLIQPTREGLKTFWRQGQYTPRYYTPPGNVQAIADAGGNLIIAPGEFDLATFVEIGCRNVVSFSSENAIPRDLPEVVAPWGVTSITIYPDHDDAGYKSARKIVDALSETGIMVNVFSLGQYATQKGFDTNDLWQLVRFDRAAFQAALQACPLADLPPSEHKPKVSTNVNFDHDDLPAEYFQAIVKVCENQPQARRNGDWLNCCSPLREDKHRSFGLNLKTGAWKDLGTGESGYVTQIGDQFNIPRPQRSRQAAHPRPVDLDRAPDLPAGNTADPAPEIAPTIKEGSTPAPTGAWFPDGVPDSWRSLMLAYLPQIVALTVELANHAAVQGLIDPADFTAADLLDANRELGFEIPDGMIRRGLKLMSDLDCQFFSILDCINTSVMQSISEKNSKSAGRNHKHYQFMPRTALRAVLLAWAIPRIYAHHHKIKPNDPLSADSVLARITPAMLATVMDTADARQIAPLIQALYAPLYGETDIKAGKRAYAEKCRLIDSLNDLTSTPLMPVCDGWKLPDSWYLRASFFRAWYEAHGKPDLTYSEKTRLMGCSRTNVTKVLELAGIESTPQTESYPLTSVQTLDSELTQARETVGYRGKAKTFTVRDHAGKPQRQYFVEAGNMRDAKIAAHNALKNGLSVTVDFQVCNHHAIVRQHAPQLPQREPAAPRPAPRRDQDTATQTAPRLSKPLPKPGYDKVWVREQLVLGWYRLTGEVIPDDLPPLAVIEMIVERHVAHPDPLIERARIELGAAIV